MKLSATLLGLVLLLSHTQAQSLKPRRPQKATPETKTAPPPKSILPTALENIIEIKGKIAALNNRISAIDNEVEEISTDQERLRKNIEVLKDTPETKQLLARYVTKAGEQETRLEQVAKEKRAASNEEEKLQKELSAAIRALNLNRKLEAK